MNYKYKLNEVAKGLAGLLLAMNLYGCANPEIKSGYNGLETAVTNERGIRSRLLVNKDLHTENVSIGYHGLTELDNLDPNTHFGRHGLTVGENGNYVQGITVLKTGNSGITDSKYGIRFSGFKKIGGYGFADLTTDNDSSNLSIFYGRPLGKFSVELYEAMEFPFNSDPTSYTELQVNRRIGNRISVFTRGENTKFRSNDTKVLVGLVIKF